MYQLGVTTMPSLTEILEQFSGQPIPHCPGRYVLRGLSETAGPEIVCPGVPVTRHVVATTRDTVVVCWLTDWGLISYARADGTGVDAARVVIVPLLRRPNLAAPS